MCLTVKEGCKPEIAEKDILCYKIVDSCGDDGWKGVCNYSCHTFKWNKVETARNLDYSYQEEPTIQHLDVNHYEFISKDVISAGFHARLKKLSPRNGTGERTCIIPAGTEYCLGTCDEVVAIRMIVFRTRLDYYMYKFKNLFKVSRYVFNRKERL